MLQSIPDEKLKEKAKLLADAAISGAPVRKMTARCPHRRDLRRRVRHVVLHGGPAPTVVATSLVASVNFVKPAANTRRRLLLFSRKSSRGRRLAQTTSAAYDVDVFFDSTTIDVAKLDEAVAALTQSGVAVEYVEKVDPVQELKTIPGVDESAVEDPPAVDAKEAAELSLPAIEVARAPPGSAEPPPPPPASSSSAEYDARASQSVNAMTRRRSDLRRRPPDAKKPPSFGVVVGVVVAAVASVSCALAACRGRKQRGAYRVDAKGRRVIGGGRVAAFDVDRAAASASASASSPYEGFARRG